MAINWETKSSNVNNISKKGGINWGLSATKTNAGGLGGGLKFIGTNIAAGAFGILEGAYDFTVGGIADLFGADEYAKKLHANDISGQWQQKAAEKFNPSKGWEFAGQVASGIGQSAVGIGAAVLTGGSSLAAGASIGLGAAGKSTTAAYQQTGELGAKEYVYGAATGLLEASLETFTGAAGKIGKRIASPTAKAIAKSTVRQGIVKTMISEGIGEFFEEAIAEYVDPYLLRATKINPEAKNATAQEIAYAGLVGFFSGAFLSGTTSTASNVSNISRGNKVVADGKTNTLLEKATELKEYTDTAIAESADSNIVAQPLKQLTASVNAYDKLKNKDSLKGKMLLGEIQQGVAYVESAQGVQTSLANVKANAEALAQTEYFKNTYKDYTAADITANKDGIATKLAISDFAGKMLIPTEQYTAQMQAGQMAQGETQYNTWRESIDDKTAESVSKQLGIDIKTASYYEATKAVENYNKSGKNIPTLPDKISLKVGDSAIYRLSDGKTIGIKREADGYYVAINNADGQGMGKTSKAIPESDIDDFIATLTAPKEQKATAVKTQTKAVEQKAVEVLPIAKAEEVKPVETMQKIKEDIDLAKTEAEKETEKIEKTPKAEAITIKPTVETVKPIKTKVTVVAANNARRRLAKSSAKKMQGRRAAMAGAVNIDNKQLITDGFSAGLYNEAIPDIITATGTAESLDVKTVVRVVKECSQNNSKLIVPVNTFEIKEAIKASKDKNYYPSIFGANAYSLNFLSKILDTFINPVIYVPTKKNSVMYIKADNGEGILLPLRTERLTQDNIIYQAKYADGDTKNLVLKEKAENTIVETKNEVKKEKKEIIKPTAEQITANRKAAISVAQKKRIDNVLSKKFRYEIDGEKIVMTRKEHIEKVVTEYNYIPKEIKQKDYKQLQKLEDLINNPYNRRLSQVEKTEALKKIEQIKNGEIQTTDYRLYESKRPNVFEEITKIEYDYAKQIYEAKTKETTEQYSLFEQADNTNSVITPLKRAQTAAATVTARKYVKNFDLLDTATRGRIVEAVISGTQYEVNSTTLNAVANLLSVRKGLNISFSNMESKGLYTTIKGERFAVINPKLSDNMLRETILHELTHDLENTQGYTALQSMAVELIDTAEKQRITEQYTKYYEDNDLVKSASLIDEEITAHFFSQFMGQSDFISKYANEQLSTFQKAKKWISNLAERLKNINNQAYRAAKQLENLYADVVTTKAESKDGESKFSINDKSPYRSIFPTPRGEYTKAKIIKYLKEANYHNVGEYRFAKELLNYGDAKSIEANLYYHGTGSGFGNRLLPSIVIPRFNENDGGGGYGQKYWGISLSKSRNMASNFTAQSRSGTVYDVLLRKDAKVKEMPQIEDSVELEDIIVDLWKEGVDAVKIGNWDGYDGHSEQEIVILNPGAIVVGSGKSFAVFQKQKIPNKTIAEIETMLANATVRIEEAKKRHQEKQAEKKIAYIKEIMELDATQNLNELKELTSLALLSINLDIKRKQRNGDTKFSLTDSKYLAAVKRGDKALAQKMVEQAAKSAGYSSNLSYQGSLAFNGAAPSKNGYFDTKEGRKTAFENGEFEGDYSLGDYADNEIDNHDLEWQLTDFRAKRNAGEGRAEAIDNLSRAVKSDKRTIKIYRAVDSNIKENTIRCGDWVTPSKSYAQYHITLQDWKKGRIIEQEVSIDDIWWNGDDIAEWGYDDGKEYVYKNTSNNRKLATVTYDDNGEIIPLSQRFNQTNEDIRFSLTRDSVLTKMPTETKSTRKEKMFEGWTNLQIAFVNEQAGVEKALKALGVKNGEALTNFVRSANKAGEEMLAGNQYSASGKYQGEGLSKIFAPVIAKGAEYEQSFYDYLANYHNIDRLKQNKPVNAATAEQSNEIIESYDQTNPEFKAIAEKLWQYNRNLLQYRVDTGLITKELANSLNEMYPHYIPTFRNRDSQIGTGSLKGKFNISVKSTIKKAEGGTSEILPIGIMIARQTLETIKAGRVNTLAKTLNDAAATSNYNGVEVMNKQALTIENTEDADYAENKPNANKNEITFFDNGERVTMRVSKEIFAGFNAFSPTSTVDNIAFKALRKLNTTFKRLVTSLNPAFLVRNTVRDLQDAGLYTKYGTAFMGNYKEAINQIKTDGEYWKLYRAMGGFTSSVFDFEKGFVGAQNRFGLTKAEGNILSKGLTALENANAFVEQLPRLAEFMSSLQAGNSVEQALLDSADVTVNFGRSGNITKKLNSTLMPFLNPAIQGFDKIIRTLTGARTKKAITSLIVKAAIIGVLPQLLNQLMYDDDEDYALLRDTDKENNYLFKIGNTFIKIPKGRVVSVFSGLVNRTAQMAKGEKDVWEGYGKNVLSQITPVDNMSRTILSPFADVKNNLTWYGTAIEGREFEAVEPKNRYDERTSSIAIALGKVLNYSPKKINYLLDQYSGVIGDFILPATTSTAEKDFLSGNFTIDPVNSNRLSNKFYKLYDETNYAKSNGDTTAAYKLRYLNKIKSAVSELYNEKSAIQASNLTDKEKIAETKTIQTLINEAYKTALADIELMGKAIEATEGIDENLRYTEATRLMYGAERALREYDSSVYAKAQSMSVAGIGYDTYYSYYFGIKTLSSETDANGNAITGSKKTKVLKQIATLKIPTVQKYLLVLNSGYVISDGDIKNVSKKQAYTAVAEYISKLQATKAEKIAIAIKLGLTVKNNKIIV